MDRNEPGPELMGLNAAEREAIGVIFHVAQTGGDWPNGKCPKCGYSQARGHRCSCPVKRALKLVGRLVGTVDAGLEDDDLIVERALSKLAGGDPAGARAVIWEVVESAIRLGSRATA